MVQPPPLMETWIVKFSQNLIRQPLFLLHLLLGDVRVEIPQMHDFGGFASLLLGFALLDGAIVGASLPTDR